MFALIYLERFPDNAKRRNDNIWTAEWNFESSIKAIIVQRYCILIGQVHCISGITNPF